MLRHIYDLPLAIDGVPGKSIGLHIDLFLLGDKYDVPSLRLLCTKFLEDSRFPGKDFKTAFFFDALRRCFSSVQADGSMRSKLIVKITPHLASMTKKPGFENLLSEVPDLPRMLLLFVVASPAIRKQLLVLRP